MSVKFPPTKNAELVIFTAAFATKISAAPTSFGILASDATAFAATNATWVSAYNVASDPSTRTKSTVAAAQQAKTNVVAALRSLNKRIQAAPAVTNAQREFLGLPVRDTSPSPVPTPSFAPGLEVVSLIGNVARVRVYDAESPSRRGKPAGTAGAALYSFVGATPPAELHEWTFEGNTTRRETDVLFPATVAPGAKVWFCACWVNPRLSSGPVCASVPANLPGGVAQAA